MAAALFKQAADQHPPLGGVEVASAGINAKDGESAAQHAAAAMLARGIDISAHTAQRLDATMVRRADLILTMTSSQRRQITERFPGSQGKTLTLGECVGIDASIDDPIGGDRETHEGCAWQLEGLTKAAARRLALGAQE
jgi:protein-tyrosine-phosphatase